VGTNHARTGTDGARGKPDVRDVVPGAVTRLSPSARSDRHAKSRMLRGALALAALALVVSGVACSPVYVVKAGIAEMRILRARRPIPLVLNDTTVDADTRGKLAYVVEARRFAAEELGIDVGDSYTMYTELDRDTLAMVVSAAYKDRLVAKTWWFPIVGRVPYKGHFSLESALDEQADLEAEGYDTYVRPTAAFSTLGWFSDPVLSTALRTDEVEVVATVIHELSHQHLFVPGQVGFNESFATFVGRVGAARFFCSREGSGPDSVKCRRAMARWRDFQRFSLYLDTFVEELEQLYGNASLSFEEKLSGRDAVFAAALERFDREVAPTLEALTFGGFRNTPLNNATLMARIRYYDRLPAFDAFLVAHRGDLVAALDDLEARAGTVPDPFDLLRKE
jgi:predicted aminopeptidase